MSFFLRHFYRDLRAGNLTLVLLSLVIAISSISCISFLSDRVKQSLNKDIQASLGADRRISSDRPLNEEFIDSAEKLGLKSAKGVRFPSMVFYENTSKLVSLKAISSEYPLKGQLEIETFSGLEVNPKLSNDSVWIDSSLLNQLNVNLNDYIFVGNKKFKISGTVKYEPDRGINFVNFAPRVFISMKALEQTGLIQDGSRVTYRLWLSSENEEVLKKFDQLILTKLQPGQKIDTISNARPDLNEALSKANSFLSLIGMITILMSAVAIALASRQLANSQKDSVALMQALGCNYKTLRNISFFELSMVLAVGFFLGCFFGYLIQLILGWFLIEFSDINLPHLSLPSLWVFLQAFVIAVLLVITFSWPILHKTFKSNPFFTLRFEKAKLLNFRFFKNENVFYLIFLIFSMLLMLFVTTKNLILALIVGAGFILMAVIFFLICLLFFKVISFINISCRKTQFNKFQFVWLNFIRATKRRGLSISAQIVGLGLSISALSVSAFIQNDLVRAWENLLPDDAPNNFVINIQQDQKKEFVNFLSSYNIEDVTLYPMVKGRLIKKNDIEILPQNFELISTRRLLNREINLSYGIKIPSHNQIIDGDELNPDALEVSVEKGYAKNFDIQVGDYLGFDIAGEILTVKVTSIRNLKWESMEVNFFMFLSQAALIEKPQSAITAFYLNSEEKILNSEFSDFNKTNSYSQFKSDLLNKFSNLTIVDTDLIAKQVRRLISQSVFAVQFLFLFCLLSGCMVLWTSLSSSREERIREIAIYRSLGATKYQLALSQWFELCIVGFLTGFIATFMAQFLAIVIANYAFQLSMNFNFASLFLGGFTGAFFSLASGTLALKGVLSTPAIKILRET